MGIESSRTLLRRDSAQVRDVSSALRKEFIQTIVASIRNSRFFEVGKKLSRTRIGSHKNHNNAIIHVKVKGGGGVLVLFDKSNMENNDRVSACNKNNSS
jgi:hypothetical protein